MPKEYFIVERSKYERKRVKCYFIVRLYNYVDNVVVDYHRKSMKEARALAEEKYECPQVSKIDIVYTERFETVESGYKEVEV